jgi:hypothetical protein
MGCAALQQAVSKTARGSANVQAGATGDVDLPVIEGALQFKPAAADVGHVVAQKTDGGVARHRRARLVDLLLIHKYAARQDKRPGAFPAGNHGPLNQQEIDTGFASGNQFNLILSSGLRLQTFTSDCFLCTW